MTYTRRSFLETTAALAAAAGLGRAGPLAQSSGGTRPSGAPGVELNVETRRCRTIPAISSDT